MRLDASKIITVDSRHYRISDRAVEMLTALSKLPGVNISLFGDFPGGEAKKIVEAIPGLKPLLKNYG